MNGLNYLLQTNLYLLLFMGFYVLVLRNETFFRQNRFFLNTSIFLSFLIPFINSDWFRDLFITQKVREATLMPSQLLYETVIVGINEEGASLTVADAIFWIYLAGAAMLSIRFLIRVASLKSNLRAKKGSAFSFFKTLVIDKEIPEADTIINHEKVHMRQWHSADIIFFELAAIINWFNPVMYLYKKEIRHIHEYIADEEAAKIMTSKADYALLLFSNTLGVDPHHLSNNFFNKSLLKRRIIMLNKAKSRRTGLWKYGFSAPLFILMLIFSAATVKSEKAILKPVAEKVLSPLSAETSKKIIEALDLDNPFLSEIKSTTKLQESTNTKNSLSVNAIPDFTVLKKYFLRTLKFPAAARDNKIQGFVIATFNITNKEITGANVIQGLQTNANGEVLRTITSFRDKLDVPDNTYTIAVKFMFSGSSVAGEFIPQRDAKNYIGQITVLAMHPDSSLRVKDFIPGANPANSLGLEQVIISSDNKTKAFGADESLPQFPGGMEGLGKYLSANLTYPAEARTKNITGRVILAFIVEKDGSLSEIKVLRGIGGGADEEAVRVLNTSPKWKPGIQDGRPVRVAYTMPVLFQLAAKPPEAKP